MRGEKVHQQALHLSVGAEPPRHPGFPTHGVRLADEGLATEYLPRRPPGDPEHAARQQLGLSPRCFSSTSTPLTTRMDPAPPRCRCRGRATASASMVVVCLFRTGRAACREEHEASLAAARRR